MSYEDFDGWDESFLDEAIRAEERALAGRSAAPPPAPAEPELPLLAFSGPSFSPPRELSQRVSTKRPAPAIDFFPDGDFEAAQLFPPFLSTASRAVKKNDRNDVEVFSFRFFCDKVCIFDPFGFWGGGLNFYVVVLVLQRDLGRASQQLNQLVCHLENV